jgi:hypothetical protein
MPLYKSVHNLLNLLVQIANTMRLQSKNLCPFMLLFKPISQQSMDDIWCMLHHMITSKICVPSRNRDYILWKNWMSNVTWCDTGNKTTLFECDDSVLSALKKAIYELCSLYRTKVMIMYYGDCMHKNAVIMITAPLLPKWCQPNVPYKLHTLTIGKSGG